MWTGWRIFDWNDGDVKVLRKMPHSRDCHWILGITFEDNDRKKQPYYVRCHEPRAAGQNRVYCSLHLPMVLVQEAEEEEGE